MKQIISIILTIACAQPLSAYQNFQGMSRRLDSRFMGASKIQSEHPDHPETASCKYLRPAAGSIVGAVSVSVLFTGTSIMTAGWKATSKELPFVAAASALGGATGAFIRDNMRNKGYSAQDSYRIAAIAAGTLSGLLATPVILRVAPRASYHWVFPLFALVGATSGILGAYTAEALKTHLH